MFTFLSERNILIISGAYIAFGIVAGWSFARRWIEREKAHLMYRGFSPQMIVICKCFVTMTGTILWPFVLRRQWKDREESPSNNMRLAVSGQQKAVPRISAEWSSGQAVLNDYVVERELGEGGMGKVYLVKSASTNMRFAVKRAKGLSESVRKNFLSELQTWTDLPEHGNLVCCRFFRTTGDEVLIFAEYVAGGSLKNRIDSRKLYEGGRQKRIERLLDAAIQFAWSLQCLHQLGLVHQDVKPANVMIETGAEGLNIKLTDYGLARAQAIGEQKTATGMDRSILVSSGGYTPAYCSPEQADGRKLDRRTDIWSWGLSILEMFHGQVFWPSGRMAREALAAFLEHNGEQQHIPAMPKELADILRDCFQEDVRQRPENFEDVILRLRCMYRTTLGTEYARVLKKIDQNAATPATERRNPEGIAWRNPIDWLERALAAEGREPRDAVRVAPRQSKTPRGQLVADMAVYDEARRIYERLVESGRKDLAHELSILCLNAACIHEAVDDFPGAIGLYDRAIETLKEVVIIGRRYDLIDGLLLAYEQKAKSLTTIGDNRGAKAIYDHMVELREQLRAVNAAGGKLSYSTDEYWIYGNKAVALMKLGDSRSAIQFYDRAIGILERLVNLQSPGPNEALATAYANKAIALHTLGEPRAAVALFDHAIEIRQKLVDAGRRELAKDLSAVYMNKAVVVGDLGDAAAAVSLFDRAIEILEQVITVDGRLEFANDLAGLYMNKGIVVNDLGDLSTAVSLYERAIEIREWLVNNEGRRELANGLAKLYVNKANALAKFKDPPGVPELYDRAIKILDRLINADGRHELNAELGQVYTNKANFYMIVGDNGAAVEPYDLAIEIFDRLINVERRNEFAKHLAMLYRNKANAFVNLGQNRSAVEFYDQAGYILERSTSVDDRRNLVQDIAERRRKAAAEAYKQQKEEPTQRLTDSLASAFSGQTFPIDIVNAQTDEIVIPANRKLSKTVLRRLAQAHDRFEMDAIPIRNKIYQIIQPYKDKFVELERQLNESGVSSIASPKGSLPRQQALGIAQAPQSTAACTSSRNL